MWRLPSDELKFCPGGEHQFKMTAAISKNIPYVYSQVQALLANTSIAVKTICLIMLGG